MRTILFSLGLLFLGLNGFSQQVAKSLTSNGTTIGFYEYKPRNYNDDKNKKYPLIIFLHGIGERGNGTSELPLLLTQGIPKNINEGSTMTFTVNGKTETFLVLSPQLPKWLGAWDNLYVDAMLDYAKKNLRVDNKRVFLTGLSLGGGGVWTYASSSLKNAKQFAAIAPICGVCYYDLRQLEPTIGKADIGVWGFANMDDNIVSPWCTISAIEVLAKANPKKVKKTINQWGGHDAWTKAYDQGHGINSPNIYEWFLDQADNGNNDNNNNDNNNGQSNFPVNSAPVAKAGDDIAITLPTSEVTLNNAGSYDSDGSIKGWNWSRVSGPSQPTISSANSAATAVKNLVEGTYVFRLTVTDNSDATATDDVTVVVSRAKNIAPVAKAGNDIAITLPVSETTLSNAGSYDSDGNIKGWSWTKVSGPSQFSIASVYNASTAVKNLVEGTYVFRLTVTDNENATDSDDVTVTVSRAKNVAPVAKAGNDITITLPDSDVTLSNAGSYDSDGDIKGWNWAKVSGPSQGTINSANSSSTTVKSLVEGTYVFRLTVTDNDNATATDDISVTVNKAKNAAPVAKAGNDINITLPANSVTLSNAGSYDSDGNIKGWNWTKVSGPSDFNIKSANNSSTEVTNLVAGSYVFRLVVTDNDNATDADDITVNVSRAPNKAPVAKAGNDVNLVLPSNATTLSNAGSYDDDGTIKTFNWSKISGPSQFNLASPAAASTQLNNLVMGNYVFRLTVTDDDGATSSDDVAVNVNKAANQSPVAKAGNDINITLPVNSVNLSNAGSSDPDGNINGWNWSKISGPSQFTLTSANAASTAANGLVAGTYVFRLTVTDDDNATGTDDVTVNVYPAPVVASKPPVANAGKDETIPVGQATVLHGENSYAQAGNIKSYKWSKVSGPAKFELLTPDGVTTWIRNMEAGVYVYRVTVTDNSGATDADDVTITVKGSLPVANAGKDETIPVGQATMLRGDASYVLGGTVTKYSWMKISGPANYEITTPDAKSTWIRYMAAGVYVYRLTIKDNNGYEGFDDVVITVKGSSAPVANAGKDEAIPTGQATILRGDNSYSNNGTIKSYAWSKISGPNNYEMLTPAAQTTWIRNMIAGTYIYRLTVTDNTGATAYDDVTITVNASSPSGRSGTEAGGQGVAPQETTAGAISIAEKLNIYPNPVVSMLNIRWSGLQRGSATIKIIDNAGRVVKTLNVKKEQADFNTSVETGSLAPGLYMIQIQSHNGKPLNTQFLKR